MELVESISMTGGGFLYQMSAMLLAILSLMTSLLLYGLLGLLLLWCWYQWTHRELLRQAEKLPSVLPRHPIIGSLYGAVGSLESITTLIIRMWTLASNKGIGTYCSWVGPVPLIITQDPVHIKKLLNSSTSLRKGEESEHAFRRFLEEGLLTSPVDRWKLIRRNLNPVFHPQNLEHMVSVFNDNSRELVQNLSEHVDGPPMDVLQPLSDLALKTVCHLMFGPDVKVDIRSKTFQDLKEVVERFPIIFTMRIIKIWLKFDLIFNFLYRKEIKKMEETFHRFSEAPLKQLKENYKHKNRNTERSGEDENIRKYHNKEVNGGLITAVGVYNWMKESLSFITDRSLQHEMMTLYLTGTDTIGNGVASCLLALAQYQEMQEKVHTEITSVIGPDDDVTSEDLKNFPYMEQVFKETLRFFTIVPFLSRRSTEEYKLGPCTVPAGTTMFMCLGGLHMDPKIFPEPHKFDPERFSSDKPMNTDGYTYIPFAGGPRNCIGKTYSYMLMKIILVHVLRKYKLSTNMNIHTMKKNYAVTMVNLEGYNIVFSKRS